MQLKKVALVIEQWVAPLYGKNVAIHEWVESIVEFADLDEVHLFYVMPSDEKPLKMEFYGLESLFIYSIRDLPHMLSKNEYIVIQGFNTYSAHLQTIRERCSCNNAPVSVITHALSYHHILLQLIFNLLTSKNPGDSILCATDASRKIVENIILQASQADELKSLQSKTSQLYVMPHGIDTEYFRDNCPSRSDCRSILGLPKNAFIVGSVGRISPYDKIDYDCLLKSFEIIKSQAPEACLLIAGDDKDNYSGHLLKILKEMNIGDNIKIITNFEENIKRLIYRAMDVFISLANSPQESFGLTILEAMASGLPVLATDWNGYKCLIKDNYNGILINTRWSGESEEASLLSPILPWQITHSILSKEILIDPGEVAIKTLRLYSDQELRKDIVRNAFVSVQEYQWKHVIKKLEAHWYAMLEKREKCGDTDWFFMDYKKIFSHYPTEMI